MSYPTKLLVEMGTSLVSEAEHRGAMLRLLGGLAFYLNSPNAIMLPEFKREYKDLDFAVNKRGARFLDDTFQKLGWKEDSYFNALHGANRMLYYYEENLQADIFVGEFEQCHKLEFKDRLKLSSPTLPISDLLLTKLQIHELNYKDVQDIVSLVLDHDFGRLTQSERPELNYIIQITDSDWGWYTTVHDNLVAIEPMLEEFLYGKPMETVIANITWIRTAIENAPKSLGWKMRSTIGRKVQWYELPEEVNR